MLGLQPWAPKFRNEQACPDLLRFLDPPAHGLLFQPKIWTAGFVMEQIDRERKIVGEWFDSPRLEDSTGSWAWWTSTLIFFREMALLGFPSEGKLDLKLLDEWIEAALAQIRERILRAGKSSAKR